MNDEESRIFASAIPFKNPEVGKKCNEMIESLSEEQIEQAACTSYAYLKASRISPRPTRDIQVKMALRMARRHLMAEKENKDAALQKMKSTLIFRQEMKIDDLRQHYCDNNDIVNNPVARGLVVCGYDIENRAIILRFLKYYEALTDENSFLKLLIYNIERAIACTERKSLGKEEKILCAVDHLSMGKGVTRPSLSLIRKISSIFQNHYPERLHLFIPSDPPLLGYIIIKMALPFLDQNTKEKIKIVSGEKQKEKELKSIVHENQAMPWLRAKGKIDSWDCENYYQNIAFDVAANE